MTPIRMLAVNPAVTTAASGQYFSRLYTELEVLRMVKRGVNPALTTIFAPSLFASSGARVGLKL
ncbi:MAG: hypothetical protein GTN80_04845 [Nitrososphaeria archaeon]|nr:hypothetical protein [Nitrososphaeria archaeon]